MGRRQKLEKRILDRQGKAKTRTGSGRNKVARRPVNRISGGKSLLIGKRDLFVSTAMSCQFIPR